LKCLGEDGGQFFARVIPYRTGENEITGVVLTFLDIDARHVLEAAKPLWSFS